MEKIINELEKDLIDIIKDKPLNNLRKDLGDEVNIRYLRMIVFGLQWTSVGYQAALRLAGMKFGKRIGTVFEQTELSLVIEGIKKIIETLRNGKVKIEVLPKLKGIQLNIYESSISWAVPDVSQKLCFFEEGFIEGFIDGVISKRGPIIVVGKETSIKRVSVEEKKCVGLGDNFCGFLISF